MSAFTETLSLHGRTYHYASLANAAPPYELARLPFSLKILLENLLRHHDGGHSVGDQHVQALVNWDAQTGSEKPQEISFMPARVLLQDFTGVPCVVDLAAMREAMVERGGDPQRVNPQIPSELVIDHSIQVDVFGRPDALSLNGKIEFERNQERYAFLRWGQQAFEQFKVVPPNTGIVHQVNLEYLARVVEERETPEGTWIFPDTVFGTDSHTTMVNGLGVLGWGVGGIEAEAAMLGEPSTLLIPEVVGVELTGTLREGVTATDLVLTVTERLRKLGVVGKFVEFHGEGLQQLPLADRATIANMAPEYGATCGMFPIDQETLNYLTLSGRSPEKIALVEAYAKAQGLWHEPGAPKADYSHDLKIHLADIEPSLAGPKRPQDRVRLEDVSSNFSEALLDLAAHRKGKAVGDDVADFKAEGGAQPQSAALAKKPVAKIQLEDDTEFQELTDGSVVLAAITSCTNTSNPAVMLAAGLLAQNARRKGLHRKPWVKTSMGPGSKVVTDYLERAGVLPDLEALGFQVVGYGCTTCIGNSGPLPKAVSAGIAEWDLVVASVLSGNRNFEGRIHPEVKANYLASPPLVVAYALAGTVERDLTTEPLGMGKDGSPVYLKDIWPSNHDIQNAIAQTLSPELFESNYARVFEGDERWNAIKVPQGERYAWDATSTYIKHPPYFQTAVDSHAPSAPLTGARALAILGDSITTDHISPAGNIKADSPAGRFLQDQGILPADFNSYGSRRGNDDVMVRGTFANIRLRNQMAQGKEGGYTLFQGGQEPEILSMYDAAMRYKALGTPLVVLAGKEYGTGSSRDWAAKGTQLLGVKAIVAESFERIHRANLVGMGVLPCRFQNGQNAQSLNLDGSEVFRLEGFSLKPGQHAIMVAQRQDGSEARFTVDVLLQTPKEVDYYAQGGLLPYVLNKLLTA